ncbi:MAG: efflux RND transporter periplasmic adaptor subunit [Gammaproteobacteria bacterium]|nr:efflux RND transporter periplasmic adaptor subunit [Gammaproteobacteria bacterium]
MKKFWRYRWYLGFTILGFLAWWAYHEYVEIGLGKVEKATALPSRIPLVTTEKVEKKDIRIILDVPAVVQPFATVVVRSKIDAQVQELHFSEGQAVKKGQVLAMLDRRAPELLLKQAQAQLDKSLSTLQQAKTDFNRAQALLKLDAVAQQPVETLATTVKQLEASVQSDTSALDMAKLQLSYTTVEAPISGTLGLRQVEVGQMAKSTDVNGIVTINQSQALQLIFALPDRYATLIKNKLASNEKIPVLVLGEGEKPNIITKGLINSLDNSIDTTTGTLRVKALINNKENTFYANQFVRVKVIVDTLKQQLVVPMMTIQRSHQGAYILRLDQENTAHIVPVIAKNIEGRSQVIEVLKGELKEGDEIISRGGDRIRDKTKVQVRNLPSEKSSTNATNTP